MQSFVEKRKHGRIGLSVPLRYQELRGNTYLSKGTLTKDLSEGGVRFNTDAFIPLSAHLVVEMSLPRTMKAVKTIAKVAWIRKLPHGDNYEVGNHFLAMSGEDESVVACFIKNSNSSF
jgi:c-di-GMP-binding flagellar brake protein YcgR